MWETFRHGGRRVTNREWVNRPSNQEFVKYFIGYNICPMWVYKGV